MSIYCVSIRAHSAMLPRNIFHPKSVFWLKALLNNLQGNVFSPFLSCFSNDEKVKFFDFFKVNFLVGKRLFCASLYFSHDFVSVTTRVKW